MRRGSHLATVQSETEWMEVIKFVEKRMLHGVWLGCNDIDNVFVWECIEDGKRMNFSRWSVNQPDNTYDTERCLQMWRPYGIYEMNDFSCNETIRYLCKATPRDCLKFKADN